MFTGTHKGEWMGIPATGRSVSVTIFDMFRVSGGKIVEHWGLLDSGAMMEQLGVAPQV
jgi:predicted ester cyclase